MDVHGRLVMIGNRDQAIWFRINGGCCDVAKYVLQSTEESGMTMQVYLFHLVIRFTGVAYVAFCRARMRAFCRELSVSFARFTARATVLFLSLALFLATLFRSLRVTLSPLSFMRLLSTTLALTFALTLALTLAHLCSRALSEFCCSIPFPRR